MEINWFNEKPKDCIVTLSSGTLTLNKPATNYFENAYNVMLGTDRKNLLIIVKPLTKADSMRHDIPDNKKYKITVRSSYSRVTNKAFLEEVKEMTGFPFEDDTHKFKATWDSKEQLLIIDLKEEI